MQDDRLKNDDNYKFHSSRCMCGCIFESLSLSAQHGVGFNLKDSNLTHESFYNVQLEHELTLLHALVDSC